METQTSTSPRPTFLTIVCILSFVGLGWAIVNNLFTLAFSSTGSWLYDLLQTELEKALNEASRTDPAAAVFLENIFEGILQVIGHLSLLGAVGLICSVVALIGVIFMWGLKKMGFYLYVGAKVLLIVFPLILLGHNFVAILIAFSSMIGAALFITLYALNFKHLH